MNAATHVYVESDKILPKSLAKHLASGKNSEENAGKFSLI
jgi:hypothetical protein